jgi:hypothetical protein
MDVIHILILTLSIVILMSFKKITLFLLLYGTTFIYFIPIFIGHYVYMNFDNTGVTIINETIHPYLYTLTTLILLSMSLFHILAYYNFKTTIEFKDKIKMKKVEYLLIYISIIIQALVIIDLGDTIFSEDKHDIMDKLSSLYNMKIAFELILLAVVVSFKTINKYHLTILIFLFAFDLFIGFRYSLIQAVGIFLIVRFYNKRFTWKNIAVASPLLILMFSFFSIFGNLRTELRLFDFETIINKTSSFDWWLYSFTHFEPMSIFGIFNETVSSGIQCNAFDILGTTLVSSLVPFSGRFINYETFHDCFQPMLFPGFESIASNPWGEAYSFGSTTGVFLFLFLFLFFTLLASYILENGKDLLKLYFVVLLGIIVIYFQRSDINFLFFSMKRLLMAFIFIYFVLKVKFNYAKN